MKDIVIGLDFGTDSVRALLVRASDGGILGSAVRNYPRWSDGLYCDALSGRFRQHPLDYVEAMTSAVKAALCGVDASRVAAIGVDTTGSTVCAVDGRGVPLALLPEFAANPNAMFFLWKDHTAVPEAAEINAAARESAVNYLAYEGGIYSAEWFWSKILHMLRTDSAVRSAAYSFVEHCDWIPALLTGVTAAGGIMRSRCAAGAKTMWHPDWGGLPPDGFFTKIDPLLHGVTGRLFVRSHTSDAVAGRLSAEWADRLGLATDVAVGVGAFDCHMGAVGARIREGQMVKVFGTSTCDVMVASGLDRCVRGICGQVYGSVIPGLVGLEAGQSAFGDVYAWFRRLLSCSGEVLLSELEPASARISPGTTGIIALDWFNGRRTPDANGKLTGAIFGLNLGATAPMIYRALVESTAYGARKIIERFRDEMIAVNEVVAIGGISVKSDLVMQVCADVCNIPIKTVASDQVCALGAAIFASVNAGMYPSIPDAMEKMGAKYLKTYTPSAADAATYNREYSRYCRLAAMMEQEIDTYVR